MADRVHPRNSSPISKQSQAMLSQDATVTPKPPRPQPSDKPVPPSGTYILKIPKDQVYRVPPPENARHYDQYSRRDHRRSQCCCCFCWLIGFIFILVMLLSITASILYLIFRPEASNYSIDSIAIRGINVTSSSSAAAISPEFDVTVRTDNPNDKIGILYETDSFAEIFYNDVRLCNGVLPAFYQSSNNVTVFKTILKGNKIQLRSKDQRVLLKAQTKREIPLIVSLRAPVKIKVVSIKTWKITVKVDCDVTLDGLTTKAKIVCSHCNYRVDLW